MKIKLVRGKIDCTVAYVFAPYFQDSLLLELSQTSNPMVAFDESLNKVSQKDQMDVFIRSWSVTEGTMKTRYLTSCFLGHTRAEDLAFTFKRATHVIS